MDRRAVLRTIALSLLAAPLATQGQPAGRVYRIGFLLLAARDPRATEDFAQALRALGYVEGQNVVIEYRIAEGQVDRLPGLAAELVRLPVDVILTFGTPTARAAKQATATTPIVFNVGTDPVHEGLVASLARPGGNLTGVTIGPVEIEGKRLELLKETVPRLSRVAYLWDAAVGPSPASSQPAQILGIQVQFLEVKGPQDFTQAFEAASRGRAQALYVDDTPMLVRHHVEIAHLAARSRLPAVAAFRQFAEAGLLMSYGVNTADLHRRRAALVDKILKGAKPADLPVEQPTRFDLVINVKTAKALGLAIPPSMLVRAAEVIE